MYNRHWSQYALFCIVCMLAACEQKPDGAEQGSSSQTMQTALKQSEVLPNLSIQEQRANYALPFCEKKNCIDISIRTVHTQDAWLNRWIEQRQSSVVQQQIGLKQELSLQQAINAFVKASDQWQDKYSKNRAYALSLATRIASQRNQYVLLQLGMDSKIEELTIKDRQYFFVADRKLQKTVSLLEILQPEQQLAMNSLIQQHYQDWLKTQSAEVRTAAPKKLYWGQADWFFDHEGVGVHYRANEIASEAEQLDIYLNRAQTQKLLKPEIYQQMF